MADTTGEFGVGSQCATCGSWVMPGIAHLCQVTLPNPLNPWPPQPGFVPSIDYGLQGRVAALEARVAELERRLNALERPSPSASEEPK